MADQTPPRRREVTYRGYYADGEGIVELEGHEGETLGRLPHVVRHSPTGVTWGYAGSGPADLARSLLINALGDEVFCAECQGSGFVVIFDTGAMEPYDQHDPDEDHVFLCYPCRGEGYNGQLLGEYQQFKFDVVCGLPEEWSLTRSDILGWLAVNNTYFREGLHLSERAEEPTPSDEQSPQGEQE